MLVNRQRFKSTQTQYEQHSSFTYFPTKCLSLFTRSLAGIKHNYTNGKVCYGGDISFINGNNG